MSSVHQIGTPRYSNDGDDMAGDGDVLSAGQRLKRLRESFLITPDLRDLVQDERAFGLTMQEVEYLTHGEVPKQVISKLERGEIKYPSMRTLVALGEAYRLAPNDMAALFDYWEPYTSQAEKNPKIRHFLREIDRYEAKGSNKAQILVASLESALRMVEQLPE